MQSIQDILKSKIEAFNKNPASAIKFISNEYRKNYNDGVNHFLIKINEDRKRDNLPPLPFIAVKEKLIALKEIDDIRWFYGVCKKYATTKDVQGNQNTFSKCFWGSLKNKQI